MIRQLWDQVWPNAVAPSIWSILAVAYSHYRTHRKLDAQTKDLKEHVSQETSR